MSDLSKLISEISPEQRELLRLRLGKKKAQSVDPSGSRISAGQSSFPLSYAQLRLWFLDQLNPGSSLYNVYFAFRLQGPLNVTALEQSFEKILIRHEILRASFTTVDDQPVQIISPEVNLNLPVVDLSELPRVEREAAASQKVVEETRRPFDLTRGPLFRVTLLKLGEQEHVLQFTVHHIVSDGWSLEILLEELSHWYKFFTSGGAAPQPLPLSYFDYVYWQREKVEGEILNEQLPYWRQQLNGARPVMGLPLKSTRPTSQSFNGTNQEFTLPGSLRQALKTLSQREGVTLYMTLLAAFQLLLHRYSSQDNILVGSPTAGRNRMETEALIGMFVNTVMLRSDFSGNPSFRELLRRVREVALGAMAHQELPFEKVVEDLQPERSLSHMPLFNIAFVFQKALQQRLQLPGVTATRLKIEGATAKFDLTLYVTDDADSLEGVLEYNTDLFAADTIKRMVGHFETLLEGIVADPDRCVSSLPLLTAVEEQQLLVDWNETSLDHKHESCVHELFEKQVQRRPGALAVSQQDHELTYGELNARANQLAHYLRKLGVGPETPVGICMDRSIESVVAYLGVLKAGGAFVPLDPAHPQERLAFMLNDAQVSVLLSTQRSIDRYNLNFENFRLICLDTDWPQIAKEKNENLHSGTGLDNLAYMIYTSGSTGGPKGVEIPHAGLLNLCVWHGDVYRVTASDRATHLAAPAFDASVWEVWPYLTAGASIHIPDEETLLSPTKLMAWLEAEAITISFMPTPLGEALLEEPLPERVALRTLLVGGDKLHRRPRHELPFTLANNYGPTENSVVTTWTPVTADAESNVAPPIGRPVANTQVYVLDRNLQPVPIGLAGELCIGGDSLARGYHNRPDLTAEKFVSNFLSKDGTGRLYRTGDRVRYLPDGNIEFLGRFDNQIKLRGFRIELGEIEAVLDKHPAVQRAVVIAREDTPGDKRLTAYAVVNPASAVNTTELRDFMKSRLPDYMIPATFIMMDQLPLTANGKVDLRALPAPDQVPAVDSDFAPLRSPVEEMLAEVWAEILGLERVGVHDNFFELGGHSLLATQVISRVRKMFAVELPLRVVFEAPTVAELAQKIEKSHGDEACIPPLVPREPGDEIPLSFAQQRLWFLDQLEPGSSLFNVPIAIQLSGQLNVVALQATLATIVERHEILRTNYVADEGQPKQVIKQNETPELRYVDLRSSPEEQREDELRRRLLGEALQPFSLSDDLMLRPTLFQLNETEHVLLLATHHIAADGWSMGILFQEMAELYKAFSAAKPSPLPELRIQYGDYAQWQRRWLRGEALEKELSYWRTQLKSAPPVLELPTDRPRPQARSYQGAHYAVSLPESLTLEVKKLCREEGATLFMVLLAAFQILLSRKAGTEDIVVGTDVANRTRLETEGLIGFFVNLVALRTDLSVNPSFREVLRRVREMALGAYAHQQMPFEKLVEELQPERSLSRNPLVQVLFVLQNAPLPSLELPGLTVKSLGIDTETSKFDLGLFLREAERKLVGRWVYNTDLFDARSVIKMAHQYETLLGNLLAQPDARLNTIAMETETEKAQRDSERQERQLARRKNLLSARRKVVELSTTSDQGAPQTPNRPDKHE